MVESDSNIKKENTWKSPPVTISTSISHDIWNFAKENNIEWKRAMEFGIAFLGAELLDGLDYPSCKLKNKIQFLQQQLQANTELIERYSSMEADRILKENKENI